MVDTEDLESCSNCGVFYDICKVKIKKNSEDYDRSITYICPVCKTENTVYD